MSEKVPSLATLQIDAEHQIKQARTVVFAAKTQEAKLQKAQRDVEAKRRDIDKLARFQDFAESVEAKKIELNQQYEKERQKKHGNLIQLNKERLALRDREAQELFARRDQYKQEREVELFQRQYIQHLRDSAAVMARNQKQQIDYDKLMTLKTMLTIENENQISFKQLREERLNSSLEQKKKAEMDAQRATRTQSQLQEKTQHLQFEKTLEEIRLKQMMKHE